MKKLLSKIKPKLTYEQHALLIFCQEKAYNRKHKVVVQQMFSKTGAIQPLKGIELANQLLSFNALLARIVKLNVVIHQLEESTDFACFRIGQPYLLGMSRPYDPLKPVQFTTEEDKDLADIDDDPLDYLRSALGTLFDIDDYVEKPTNQQEILATIDFQCLLSCLICGKRTNESGEAYRNKAKNLVSVCLTCRQMGIRPPN